MSKNVVDMTLRANMDLSQVSSGLNQMQGILKQLKLSPTLKKDFDSLFASAAADLEKYRSKLESGFKTKGDITGFEKVAQGLEKSLDKIGTAWSKLQEKDLSKLVKLDSSSIERIQQFDNKFKELEKTLKGNITESLKTVVGQINSLSTKTSKQAGLGIAEALGAGEYKEAIALADEYIAKLQKMGAEARGGNYKANLDTFVAIRNEIAKVVSETEKYNQEVNKLQVDKLTVMADATEKTGEKLRQGANILSGVTQKTREYNSAMVESGKKTVELGADIDSLKNRVQYFFSLTNSVMLFRRILQDTIQTTKELDAAMTETAVVTDFSVADMWKDLPRYTSIAKELGATIQGVYETMTLYYQQGLKTNEVFEVGTETLKMAKIAGLDYAQATDFMTAALRGFNMEVNELNAQKVNDVYSELAAITAADTQEIATAMTKTASIASNANMEFETTAAFLSQIIETTRESAETAGTAMKTVIARFTELKKDPAEIGEVDGEIVDANKIETALRTIDVALRDTSGQFRDLDDVFLDIAEKWDGLDTNTQRYIATMAAGSRQQSRFIAMMSDYDRTMQLVSAANNSAGASQKQFDKTLESLESKLNQLKTAWQQFTMGIANNTLIKAGVDALTGLLNIINKITEHLPGATKGIGNLLLMIGGFTAGKKVMDAFFASTVSNITNLGKAGEKGGATYGISFREALNKEFGKTKTFLEKLKTGILGTNLTAPNFEKMTGQAALDLKNAQGLKAYTAAQEKYVLILQQEAAYKAANTMQQTAYNAALAQGFSLEEAGLLLKSTDIKQTSYDIALKKVQAKAKQEGIFLTKAEAAAQAEEIQAMILKQTYMKKGLIGRIAYMINQKASIILENAEAGSITKSIAIWFAKKTAVDATTASMWSALVPIGLVIAGVAALAATMIYFAKWSKEQTLEYKMEKAAEATEKAKEAAENARQAYEELNTTIEEIGTKESELEKLTYGTLEWQKALLDVNQQIMDLIDQFPQLKQDLLNQLQVEASGKLTLTTKGYDMMKEASLQNYRNALAGQVVSNGNEAYLKKQQALSNYNNYNALVYKLDDQGQTQDSSFGQKMAGAQMFNSATQNTPTLDILGLIDLFSGNTEAITERAEQQLEQQQKGLQLYSSDKEMTTLSSDQKDEIYKEFLENGRMFESNTPALQEFAKEMGIASESLLEFVPAMRERQQAEVEYGLAMQAQAKQLLLSTTSENFRNKDNSQGLADTFGQFYAEQEGNLVDTEAKRITDIKAYAKEMGLDDFKDQGSELKNLQKLYQDLTGSTKEQVEEMFGEGKEELRKAIAAIKVGKDWGKKVEDFATDLENFTNGIEDKTLAGQIEDLFGGADGTGFGYGEANGKQLTLNEDANDLEYQKLFKLWEATDGLYGQFTEFSDFLDWRNEQNKKAKELQENTTQQLNTFGLSDKVSFKTGLDLGSVSGLTQKIIDVFAVSGKDGAAAISNEINKITDSLDSEDANLFASALNGIDWESREEVLGLSETLEELGVYIDPAKGNINDLEQEIIELARATTKVSLENLTQSIRDLNKISLDIKNGENEGRSFSEDIMNTLVSTGTLEKEDFIFNIETGDYTYLGESTDKIVAAIHEQTNALLGADQLERDITTGEVVGGLKESDVYNEINAADYATKLAFIKDYNTEMLKKENGGQAEYSQDFLNKLESFSGDAIIQQEIDKIYNDLISKFLSVESNQAKYDEFQRTSGAEQAQAKFTSSSLASEINEIQEKEGPITPEDQQAIENYRVALIAQAEAAGVAESRINEYATVLAKIADPAKRGEESLDELKAQAKELEQELSNTSGFTKANKAMSQVIEKNIELLNSYEDLEDEASKVEQVQKMVDNFDLGDSIDVDTSNYQQVYDYMLGIAQGSYEAYQGLMNLAMQEFGVTVTGEGQFDGLLEMINIADAQFQQMIQKMIENGAFVEETVTVTDIKEYIGQLQKITDKDGNVTYEPITEETEVTSVMTVVRPKNAGEITTVSNTGGGGSGYTPSGGGGGGGSGGESGSEEEPWENSFDKFYNITEDINELLDERNELEREYDLLLQKENSTIDDFLNNYTDRIASFKEEIALQEEMLRLRKQDQKDILSKYSHLSEYAWVEDGKVQIDYDAINQVEDQELGEEIEEFVSKLEENDDAIQEANDAIQENTLAIEELMDDWRDATADFEQRVFDAIVEEREKEIEKSEEAAQTLDDSNSELVDAIQKEIDERRQQRENEETEKDLAEKERRLAYLQQDTSGAYDTEILQLEKDLKQQKEDYTDTLIDQKISELQEQNDEAAKQREKQIQIMQYQLKNDQETGAIAAQVSKMLQEANSDEGWARVWKLLEKSEGFKGLTDTNKAVWEEDTQREFKEAMSYLNGLHGGGIAETLEGIAAINANSYASLVDTASYGNENTRTPSGNGGVTGGGSTSLQVSQVEKNAKGIQYYKIGNEWYKASDTSGLSNGSTTLKEGAAPLDKSLMAYEGKTTTRINNLGSGVTSLKAINNLKKKGSVETIDSVEYFKYGSNYYYVADIGTYSMATGKGTTHYAFIKKGASYFKKYKTGGLADYTGPAWLDGTKSKPELVLNQKETQNFLQLKDVLSSFMKQSSNVFNNSSSNGDTIYDISISVESIANDYDVDQVANRVKQIISSDAAYRNSTMIQRLR